MIQRFMFYIYKYYLTKYCIKYLKLNVYKLYNVIKINVLII